MNPNPAGTEHEWAQAALVWWTNGTLDPPSRVRVQQHLEQCAECRALANLDARVATHIREAHEVLSFAPQPGFAKLKARIAAARAEAPVPAAATSPPRRGRALRRTLQLQAAAIAALALSVAWLVMRPAPAPYETRTRAPLAATTATQLQIVFAETTPEAQARARLARLGGKILEGPSAAGVWRLELAAGADAEALAQALSRERDVRFVAVVPP